MHPIHFVLIAALIGGGIALVVWLRRTVRQTCALAVTPMWNGIRDSSEELLVRKFTQHLGDGVIATENAVRFVQQTGEYVVEFSEKGKELLQVGQATLMRSKETGRMVPTLLDVN